MYEDYTREQAKDCVGDGWARLIDILYDAKPEDTIVVQVKEKWGGLRFYVGDSTERYLDLIDGVSMISECICEVCGKAGQLLTLGWWKTRCPSCEEEKNK